MAKYNFEAGNKRLSGNAEGYKAAKEKEYQTGMRRSNGRKPVQSVLGMKKCPHCDMHFTGKSIEKDYEKHLAKEHD